MPLHISNPGADRSAREFAKITGETIAEAVVEALRVRLVRERAKAPVDLKADTTLRGLRLTGGILNGAKL